MDKKQLKSIFNIDIVDRGLRTENNEGVYVTVFKLGTNAFELKTLQNDVIQYSNKTHLSVAASRSRLEERKYKKAIHDLFFLQYKVDLSRVVS